MDWQNTGPNMHDANPVGQVADAACASLCTFCIKFPRICFAIIAGITCWIFFSLYNAASDTPPQWTSFEDSDTLSYFEYGTSGYLNGTIWLYGNNYHPNTVYYINIADKDDDTFYIQQLNNTKMNYSFNNYFQSISDKASQTIWSIDISLQKLVSFDPYSKNSNNTKLYQIPDYYNGKKFFWPQCMTIDNDQHLLYIVGGYNNQTNYYYDYNAWGELLIFNLKSKKWDHYYNANDIGYLKTENGYNIHSYSCSYNDNWLFAFGGGYSYPMDITNKIHYIDFNNDDIKWNTLSDATLNLSLIESTAYTFGDNVYIFTGCNINHQCYVAQQIFNLPTMRVTDYDIYNSFELPYSNNYYVVNNYDQDQVYMIYSVYRTKHLVTIYFHGKIDAVYNETCLIIAILCIVAVVGVAVHYYYNKSENTDEENKPLTTN